MFCANCGNELKDGESFCPQCGTEAGASGGGSRHYFEALQERFYVLGWYKWRYVACLALQVVCLCMLKMNVYTLEAGHSSPEGLTMFVGMNWVYSVAVIGFLLGIIAMVLPLLLGGAWRSKHFLLGKIMPFLSAAWVFVSFLITKTSMESSLESRLGDFAKYASQYASLGLHISAAGWIFAVVCIITAVMTWNTGYGIAD